MLFVPIEPCHQIIKASGARSHLKRLVLCHYEVSTTFKPDIKHTERAFPAHIFYTHRAYLCINMSWSVDAASLIVIILKSSQNSRLPMPYEKTVTSFKISFVV